jgi:RNA polymerase sigma factor (sigma-70 family)
MDRNLRGENMIEVNSKEIRRLLTKKFMKSSDLLDVVGKYKDATTEELKDFYKNIIFENNVKLIYKIASRRCYGLPGLVFEDAFQWGVVGLCDGLERFDLSKNTKFSTYITWWVDKYILDYFYASPVMYVPKNVIREYRKYNRMIGEYLKTHGHEGLDAFIETEVRSKNPDWDRFKIKHLDPYSRVLGNNVVSIDNGHEDEDGFSSLEEVIADSSVPNQLEQISSENLMDKIRTIMSKHLNEKEYFVIKYRYLGESFLKLDDVASMIPNDLTGGQITRERVRQLESSALAKIKKYLAKQK